MYEKTAIYLISQSPDPHGVADPVAETERMVYATVRSVNFAEIYQAMTQGMEPTYIFRLQNRADYDGERYLRYDGGRYRVIRAYRVGNGVDLTVEEVADV